jgi:hypothetical protein
VAAPKHHKLVFENERLRILDTRIPAGDVVPVHTHRWPAVYYTITPGEFVRRHAAVSGTGVTSGTGVASGTGVVDRIVAAAFG